MSKKGNDTESMICFMPKLSQSFFVYRIQSKKKCFFFKKRVNGGLNKKWKEGFLTALDTAIKKGPIISIRNHANEMKVCEKTVRTASKQDLNPAHIPLDYAIWGILENKTNSIPHPDIGSINSAIEEEWNKMSEESILKTCKSFRRCNDTIIEKWWPYWVNLLFCIYLLILLFIFFNWN